VLFRSVSLKGSDHAKRNADTLDRTGRVTSSAHGNPGGTDAYAATVQGHGGRRLAFGNPAALLAHHATPAGLAGFADTASLIH